MHILLVQEMGHTPLSMARLGRQLRVGPTLSLALTVAALGLPPKLYGQAVGPDTAWAAVDSVVSIGTARIGLRVSAWRDFMPKVGGNTDGSPLMVNLQISELDSLPLPAGLEVDSAWVRSPSSTWATAPSDEVRPDLRNGLDLMLRGGPKWPTDQLIDVLVRLRLPSGKTHYLRARQQSIGRTM